MEFHSTVPLTGVDIPGMLIDFALSVVGNRSLVSLPVKAQKDR
jgi:hypothetical protein